MTLASVVTAATIIERTVDFWTITVLLALLFGLFGFIQGPTKAAINVAGIFLAYGTAIKTADFARKSINFIVGTHWDQTTLPKVKFGVFLVAFAIVFISIRAIVKSSDRFSAKLVGLLIGHINGVIFSTLTLEFMSKYWKEHPPQANINMDISWAFRMNPGNMQLKIKFLNNPVVVFNFLDTFLKFLLYAVLFLVIPPVFFGLLGAVKKITSPLLNFLGLSEEKSKGKGKEKSKEKSKA